MRAIEGGERPFQRIHVTPARHDRVFADRRAVQHAFDHRLFQLGESGPLEGGYARRRHLPCIDHDAGRTAAQVDLVPHHDTRRCGGGTFQERHIRVARGVAVIDDHDHQIRVVDGACGPLDADSLHRIRGLAKAGGVVHVERNARDDDPLAHHVARRTRDVGHDRGVGAGKAVEQARLPDVRCARDHQLDAVAQHRAAMGAGQGRSDRVAQRRETRRRLGGSEEIELFIRKIDRRLDERTQLDEPVTVALHDSRELARERPAGASHRRRGRTVDEVGDRLGLRQIDAIVEKGAQRELAGPGRTGAELADALQHHARDDDPAVAVELQDVLAGERARRLEPQCETVVDHRPRPIPEPGAGRDPWSRHPAEHAVRNCGDQRPRDAHDRDPAPSGRSRDSRDRIAEARKVHRPAKPGRPSRSVRSRPRSSS